MRPPLVIRAVVVAALAVTGVVGGSAQPSSADDSSLAWVLVTAPYDNSSVYGRVMITAHVHANSAADPPQEIQVFIDGHNRPFGTKTCDLSYTDCDSQMFWHTDGLGGPHTISASAILADPTHTTVHSPPVHVYVKPRVRIVMRRPHHPRTKHKMIEAGKVISLMPGHPAATHVPVTLTVHPAHGTVRLYKATTNRHGRFRFKLRATMNSRMHVTTSETVHDQIGGTRFEQLVRGEPRCQLSKRRAKIKQPVILRCHMQRLPLETRFKIEERTHGRWLIGPSFKSDLKHGSRLFISGLRRGTLVLREEFARNEYWDRSTSNVVRLHVT